MGLPMARHLARGFAICGFDVDSERRRLLEEYGATAADNAAAAARGADVAIVAVRTLAQAPGFACTSRLAQTAQAPVPQAAQQPAPQTAPQTARIPSLILGRTLSRTREVYGVAPPS